MRYPPSHPDYSLKHDGPGVVSKERREELKKGSYPDLWEAEALVREIEELEKQLENCIEFGTGGP